MLLVTLVIVGMVIAPTIWRYSSYRKVRLTMERGDEAEAIRLITKLHDNPLFDLDWTIQNSVKKVPHGFAFYEKVFGCPSCRGDFYTLLYHSAYNGHAELTRTMIQFGAPLERWNDSGERVLRAAINSKNTNVIELVINSGADVNAMGDSFDTYSAIHLAVMPWQSMEIVNLLLDHGADINAKNNGGWTPLDVACIWNTNAIPDLIELGAVLGTDRKRPLPGQGEAVAKRIKNMHHQKVKPTVKTPIE